jgi:diacylglycerol kinase family enzyme
MRFLVLLNESAGTLANAKVDDAPRRIADGFRAAGVDADVRSLDPATLAEVAGSAARPDSGFDAVVGGGGDGTLNTIANALAGTAKPFGVLPLGTHNHFAKDMNVPLDLGAAVAALARAAASGAVRDVDVGEVNGRIFLNFSGIGLHPLVVRHRDAQRAARGRHKFVALFVALFRVLRRLPVMRVRIDGGGRSIRRFTPSVVVCNNPHQMQVIGVETVSHPDRGMLNVYLARSTGWVGLAWLIVRGLFRRLNTARNFEAIALRELAVSTRRRVQRVSVDGEVVDMKTPLRYRVRRGGLKVIVPQADADAGAETPPEAPAPVGAAGARAGAAG